MISIIPLLVVFAAYVSEKAEPEESNIEVATVSCTSNGISFFARNTGNRPALLMDEASYRVQASNKEVAKGSLFYPALSDGHLMAPDEGRLFRLKPVKIGDLPGQISPMPTDDASCLVELNIKTIEFEGVEETRTVKCACSK